MSKLFGGSKSSSSNKAYDGLNKAFSPLYGQAQEGANAVSGFLGGDASGFNKYKEATGFQGLLDLGTRGLTGSMAARGLLRSGTAGKSLVDYGNTMQNQYANQYLQGQMGRAGLGFNAGNLVSGAGNVSNSQQHQGILSTLMAGAQAAAMSDIRLKKAVKLLGKLHDGLGVYSFQYFGDPVTYVGVIAQQVAKLRPKALGPVINGYLTVNYGKL